MARKYDSSTRVLTFVLTVAFGLVAAVIAYATFGGSFELRSKAATEEVILKLWTFDANQEGWLAKDFSLSTVSKGMYQLSVNSNKSIAVAPQIIHTSVQTTLKYPVNKFRIRLAVTTQATSYRLPQAYPFTIKVSQTYQGKTVKDAEQLISAIADGKEHEYAFAFPKVASLKRVDALQIQFLSLPQESKNVVSVNDIALIGLKSVAR